MNTGKRFALKLTSLVLAALMLSSLFAVGISAASFGDTATHWSSKYVDYMVQKGIIKGYDDGTFKPDNVVTRAEFIKMLDVTFGLTSTTSISYSDVNEGDWYYTYIQEAAAQGYLIDYGSALAPNTKLTREEAFSLLVRYLNISDDVIDSSNAPSDYSSISSAYRSNILKAYGAGLVKGYEDGTFRPKNTLTRAEAMTILYRAAGTIYQSSKSGSDADANSENAVVASSGITVRNAKISGNVYVTEGALNGIVTFSGCTFTDDVYLRGSVRLVLDDCTINALHVDSISDYSTIQLTNGTTVAKLEINTPSDVTASAGTTVSELDVASSAPRTTFEGSGKIAKAVIAASKFESDVIPSAYEIQSGISATFADNTYSGKSTDTNGFTSGPTLNISGATDTVTFTPAQIGYFCYYYTNDATAPTSATFNTLYSQAAAKSRESLASVKAYTITTVSSAVAASYKYLAVAFCDVSGNYNKPVLLTRSASTSSGSYAASGFASQPYVTTGVGTSNTYDTLSFTTSVSGTLYYYYTTSSVAPTAADYFTYYTAAKEAAHSVLVRGYFAAVANTASKDNQTIYSLYLSGYTYVVLMLQGNSGYYTPLVISRTASSSSSGNYSAAGFSAQPTLAQSSYGYDQISVNPLYSGTVKYYYSNSSSLPTAAYFANYMTGTIGGYNAYGQQSVTAGNSISFLTSVPTVTATSYGYNYIILMLTASDGTTNYAPIAISRNTSSAATGFYSDPTITAATTVNGSDILNYRVNAAGTISYYYTNTSTAPATPAIFTSNYTSTNASYKNAFNAYAYNTATTYSLLPYSYAIQFNYVVVMFMDASGNYYTPVIISRSGAAVGNGFTVTPTVTADTLGQNYQISYTPSVNGYVYYLFSNIGTSGYYTSTNFSTYYNSATTQLTNGTLMKNALYASAGVANSQNIGIIANYTGYPYLIVALYNSATQTYYTPVVITLNGSSSTTGVGFSVQPALTTNVSGTTSYDYLTFTPAYSSGYVYYFYSATTLGSDVSSFLSYYSSALYKNSYAVTSTTAQGYPTYQSSLVSGFTYMIVAYTPNGTTFYQPAVITRNGSSGNVNNSSNGFYSNPTVSSAAGTTYYIDSISFMTMSAGTVYYFYDNTSNTYTANQFATNYASLQSINSTAAYTQVSTNNATTYSTTAAPYVVFCFRDSSGTFYLPVKVTRSTGGTSGTASGTGFNSTPTATANTGAGDTVTYNAYATGTIMYYFSSSNSVSSFLTSYAAASANNLSGTATINSLSATNIFTTISGVSTTTYPYLIMMVTYNNTTYTPIAISRTASASSSTYGITASVNSVTSTSVTVNYTSTTAGTVYYGLSPIDVSSSINSSNYTNLFSSGYMSINTAVSGGSFIISNLPSTSTGYTYLIIVFVGSNSQQYSAQALKIH